MLRSALHIFARRKVQRQFRAIGGVEICEAAREQGFACRDELDDGALVRLESDIDGGQKAWQFHREKESREETLFGAFEPRARSRKGLAVKRGAS